MFNIFSYMLVFNILMSPFLKKKRTRSVWQIFYCLNKLLKEQQIPLKKKILRRFWQEKPEIILKKLTILMKEIPNFYMIFLRHMRKLFHN